MVLRSFVHFSLFSIFLTSFAFSQTFIDVASDIGVDNTHQDMNPCSRNFPVGSGSAWADYDNDGDLDMYFTVMNGANFLYRNEGDTDLDGLPDFVDVAASLGVDLPAELSHSTVFIDYDNDGDQDLYVTNWGGNTFFHNELVETGTVSFTDATATTGLENDGRAITTAWGDFDQDGYLDVYLCKHLYCEEDPRHDDALYKNNGDGTFTDVSDWFCPGDPGPCPELEGAGFSAGWIDYDNDTDLDLYVANEFPQAHSRPNVLWRNDGSDGMGGWIFTDVSASSGAGISIKSMGLGVGDYDNDGFIDLAISNTGPNALLRNLGDGNFDDVSEEAGIERQYMGEDSLLSTTWGTVFFDHDNDQLLDLFYAGGGIGSFQPYVHIHAFFENDGDGTFTDITESSGMGEPTRARSASIVDLENDGYVDLLVGLLNHPPQVFHNMSPTLGNTNHWLTVTVEGTTSNRDGIGSRIYVTTDDGTVQMREITSGPTYGGGDQRAAFFGLGSHTDADLAVRWPDGTYEDLGDVSADQLLHLVEPAASTVCEDIASFQGRCVTGAPYTVQFRINLPNNTAHDGEEVTFDVDGTQYVTTIGSNGTHSRASFQVGGLDEGAHTISLVDPANCFDPIVVNCGTPNNHDLEWRATDRLWGDSDVDEADIPATTKLLDNYPNPFNPSTTIQYGIPADGIVSLKVYNTLGQEVATLVDGFRKAGYHSAVWNGRNLSGQAVSSGIYIYRLVTGDVIMSQKMILSK